MANTNTNQKIYICQEFSTDDDGCGNDYHCCQKGNVQVGQEKQEAISYPELINDC